MQQPEAPSFRGQNVSQGDSLPQRITRWGLFTVPSTSLAQAMPKRTTPVLTQAPAFVSVRFTTPQQRSAKPPTRLRRPPAPTGTRYITRSSDERYCPRGTGLSQRIRLACLPRTCKAALLKAEHKPLFREQGWKCQHKNHPTDDAMWAKHVPHEQLYRCSAAQHRQRYTRCWGRVRMRSAKPLPRPLTAATASMASRRS